MLNQALEYSTAYLLLGGNLGDRVVNLKKAIELLSANKKGFFVLIEGSQIDWGGHANDAPYAIAEMIDFDKNIGWVRAC